MWGGDKKLFEVVIGVEDGDWSDIEVEVLQGAEFQFKVHEMVIVLWARIIIC